MACQVMVIHPPQYSHCPQSEICTPAGHVLSSEAFQKSCGRISNTLCALLSLDHSRKGLEILTEFWKLRMRSKKGGQEKESQKHQMALAVSVGPSVPFLWLPTYFRLSALQCSVLNPESHPC